MADLPRLSASQLIAIAQQAQAMACACQLEKYAAWESISESQFPAQLKAIGSLINPDLYEPTFEEHHPQNTRYASPDAPVALAYFPYNRCTVYQCSTCQRSALRYTEYGGYYIDHRLRLLQINLIVD